MKSKIKTDKLNPSNASQLTPPNALVGHFFHSLGKNTSQIEWQGVVIGNPLPGWYLVQLYEWIAGSRSVQRLVKIEDMESWLFYESSEEMEFSYEQGTARIGGIYRDK